MENKKIDVTVGLPTWNNKDIIWLQLESLCRQETKYKWELIVCEEQTKEMAGKEMIFSYKKRLESAGCVHIEYIALDKHIPLSKKWWIMSKKAQSNTFLLTASDDYSPPNRIEFTQNKIKEGFNWVDVSTGLFLHLNSFTTGTFSNRPEDTGLYMGTKTKYLKNLTGPWPSRGVDSWIRNKSNIFPRYRHTKPLLGLHTDGQNKISLGRKKQYVSKKTKYFNSPKQELKDILPTEIIKKLENEFKQK